MTSAHPVLRLFVIQVQVCRLLANPELQSGYSSITLIDVQKFSNYCGMIPGYLSRQYADYQETVIDLKTLCQHPNFSFIQDGVLDIDLDKQLIQLMEDAKRIPYDVISLDIGSATKSLDDVPGAFEFTIPTRPIHGLVSQLERIEVDFPKTSSGEDTEKQEDVKLVVVGGGASGVELAMSLVGRWKPILKEKLHVTLVTADRSIMADDTRGGHRTVKEILLEKGIYICFRASVVEVEKDFLKLKSGMKVPFSHCVWATGAGCHDLARTLQQRGLAVTLEGWVEVNETLQSVSHPNVFAAGDCCDSSSLALPKAGIYSIQEGPVLARNLRLFTTPRRGVDGGHNSSLENFHPDTHGGLQFLDCGDGTGKVSFSAALVEISHQAVAAQLISSTLFILRLLVALGFAFGMVLRGPWVHDIKLALDREFITLFGGQRRPSWDNSNLSIEDEVFDEIGSMISPKEAAHMLQQINTTNYRQAWWLLKYIARHAHYRFLVLRHFFQGVYHNHEGNDHENTESSNGGHVKSTNYAAAPLPRSTPFLN